MKAILLKTSWNPATHERLADERVEIEAPTQDELLALFFREFDNRYKYVNSLSFRFEDPALAKAYSVWRADIRNYAAHGGDMW